MLQAKEFILTMLLATLPILTNAKDITSPEAPIANYYQLSSADILPYKANYNVLRRGSVYGNASQSVTLSEANSLVEVYYQSESRLLFLSDRRSERSQFSLAGGKLSSEYYHFIREGTGKDRDQGLYFDHQNKLVTDHTKETKVDSNEFNTKFLDPLSYQLLMQIGLRKEQPLPDYEVVNKYGSARTYSFKRLGSEQIKLPIGTFEAVKLLRTSQSAKRKTYVWMIPSLNFLLGQLQHIEDDKEVFMLQLESVDWLPRDIYLERRCCR